MDRLQDGSACRMDRLQDGSAAGWIGLQDGSAAGWIGCRMDRPAGWIGCRMDRLQDGSAAGWIGCRMDRHCAQRTPREIYDDAKCLLTHPSTQQKNKKTKLLAFSEKTTTMKIGFSSSRAENCDEASGVQGSVYCGSGD